MTQSNSNTTVIAGVTPATGLKPQQRILMGGLGALTPLLINLLAVDFASLNLSPGPFVWVGYLVRVLILFYIGAMVAYLYKDEVNMLKLFQLGVAAPALITSFMNAGNVQKNSSVAYTPPAISQIQVNSITKTPTIKTFALPEVSAYAQIVSGFTGRSSMPANSWYTITDVAQDLNALNIRMVLLQKAGFKPEIYTEKNKSAGYYLVIGANMTQNDARLKQDQAVNKGFKRTIIWKYGTPMPVVAPSTPSVQKVIRPS